MTSTSFTLTNEFATVVVELDSAGAGPRLKITDTASQVFTCLDPFELQSLAWTRHLDLTALMDPGHRERLLRPEPDVDLASELDGAGPGERESPPSGGAVEEQ